MRTRIFITMMTLLIVTGLSAQAYRLAFKATVGTVRTYNMKMTIVNTTTLNGQSLDTTSTGSMKEVETVLAVKPDGSGTISEQIKDGTMTLTMPGIGDATNSQTIQLPSMSYTFDRSPSGKVANMSEIKFEGEQSAMLQNMLKSMNMQEWNPGKGLVFPDKELKLGDSWDISDSMNVLSGSPIDLTGTMTLADTKVVDGKTYLVLKSDCDINLNNISFKLPSPSAGEADGSAASQESTINGTIKVQGTMLFDAQAGEFFRSANAMAMNMQISMPGNAAATLPMCMKMDMQISRAD